jgi:hypothetical protein
MISVHHLQSISEPKRRAVIAMPLALKRVKIPLGAFIMATAVVNYFIDRFLNPADCNE